MAPTEGSQRGVEIRLLEPAPKVGGRRLDQILDEPSQRLEKAHYMFLVLAAMPLELERDQWQHFCLPRRSGPPPTTASDVAGKHEADLKLLCRTVGLKLSVKPWRIQGDVDVDTRTLVCLVDSLTECLREKRLDDAVHVMRRVRECAPQLRDEVPRSWPLGKLIAEVGERVPSDVDAADAEEFRQNAVKVTGLDRLVGAIKSCKRELPRALFDALLEAGRIEDAAEVLAWVAPAFSQRHGLNRKLHDRAMETGRAAAVVREPTWVGISGGPSSTIIAAPNVAGVMSETPIAVGLGGTMSSRTLATSTRRVIDELLDVTGQSFRSIVVGCAGFDPENHGGLLRALADAATHRDLHCSLWAGNDGDLLLFAPPLLGSGVALIADMGSVVVARRPDGAVARRGGDEWLLSDHGSGYRIAVDTLTEVLSQVDRCVFSGSPAGDVIELVLAARHAFGEPFPAGDRDSAWYRLVMKRIARDQSLNWDKARLASFANQVLRLASESNSTAHRIVRSSAERLGAHLGEALAWHPDERPSLVVVGHLPSNDGYFDALRCGALRYLTDRAHLGKDRAEAKLLRLLAPATETAIDARVENPAALFAEVARMLDTPTKELEPDEAAVVTFLRDDRSRSIVEYLPRN
jgi:N-acetylglucosamine kinase-like BadF-type ATPase